MVDKIRSHAHREYVATHECMLTGKEYGVQSHHLLRADGTHGMGTKTCDMWSVPLHYDMHDKLHRYGDEVEFFEAHGWDYDQVKGEALTLSHSSPDARIRQKASAYQLDIVNGG